VQGETDIYHNMLAFLTKAIFSSALSLSKMQVAKAKAVVALAHWSFWQ